MIAQMITQWFRRLTRRFVRPAGMSYRRRSYRALYEALDAQGREGEEG